MLGFEMFDVRSWMDGALVKAPSVVSNSSATVQRVGKAARTMVVAAAITVAGAFTPSMAVGLGASATQSQVTTIERTAMTTIPAMAGVDAVRPGYWSDVIAEVTTWKKSDLPEVKSEVDAFI